MNNGKDNLELLRRLLVPIGMACLFVGVACLFIGYLYVIVHFIIKFW